MKPLKEVAPTTARGRVLRWPDLGAQPGPGAGKAARMRILESPHGIEE